MTLEGYRFFSLSLAVRGEEGSSRLRAAWGFETFGRVTTATDGDSVLGMLDVVAGESGTLRCPIRLSTYE
jgi:hypothetical protein